MQVEFALFADPDILIRSIPYVVWPYLEVCVPIKYGVNIW